MEARQAVELLREMIPIEEASAMLPEGVTLERLGHDVRDTVLRGDEDYLDGATQDLFAKPVKTSINVPAVLVRDGVVGDAYGRLVVREDVNWVAIAPLNTKIAHKHAAPDSEARCCCNSHVFRFSCA